MTEDAGMNRDRFGNPRYEGYRKSDFELCRCVTKKGDPGAIAREPKHTCSSCGGYGEIPKGTAAA